MNPCRRESSNSPGPEVKSPPVIGAASPRAAQRQLLGSRAVEGGWQNCGWLKPWPPFPHETLHWKDWRLGRSLPSGNLVCDLSPPLCHLRCNVHPSHLFALLLVSNQLEDGPKVWPRLWGPRLRCVSSESVLKDAGSHVLQGHL